MPRPILNAARIVAILLAVFALLPHRAPAQTLAPTPPMGWNSWDAYGLTIDEADFKANVSVLAGIKQYGWQYAVIDEGWYMADPFGGTPAKEHFQLDANGRLIPALNRFSDAANGAGLKPLADWVHAQGLKFGIHLLRGMPKQDLAANTPIAGSSFHARDAADPSDTCPWSEDNFGIRDNAAGQAWYDSMIDLYAGWGVDFLKVDCISDRPYKATEIRQLAEAIRKATAKTGHPIVLSLSPGPTALGHAAEVAKYAQMWRISDDHWDVWSHLPEPGKGEFPMGTRQAFDRLAAWQPYVKSGSWPDEDMLPIGNLSPHPGWGDPRDSRLTHDEQRTEFTLWAITRSPLILGNNLTKLDDFTRSLITNREVNEINQTVTSSSNLDPHDQNIRMWTATTGGPHPRRYMAVFNIGDRFTNFNLSWAQSEKKPQHMYDLWNKTTISTAGGNVIQLQPHACALYRLDYGI
ncbi:MAG TPA: glycoside hydrolase family 27 protein [Acidobacteriaceae bacterium]|jgi:hypothetical protein|nr:glycoside hydrolase family 27 protein [Acidobacteriaceae bacterium]